MKANRRPLKRPNMRRAVILFPSGFTLGNLFFGIFAIIAASRLEFTTAGVYVMLGGICDALDGRVARATNSGTQFGEELDSLVDAITFGLAPGMIMYFAVLNRDGWDWIFVFLFSACAVLRLARFNIEQAGTAKTYFQGLPSPAAGITLASFYWFSQSWLYSYGAIGDLPWHRLLRFIMAALAMLMISNVPYPSFPRTGLRSVRSLGATLVVLGAIGLLISRKLEYFFPLSLVYVSWGLIRWIFSGLFERRQPTVPYDLSEGEDDEDEEEFDLVPTQVHASRPHRAVEPEPKAERGRGRGERPDRPQRPEREARPAKTDAPGAVAAEPAAERGERPQRTEAERAARREKREKRDKRDKQREGKAERAPRPDRAERPAAAAAGVDALALGEPAAAPFADDVELPGDEQVIGTIPGGAESEAAGTASGATRKRKRRRRRSARDRNDGASGTDTGTDGGDDDAGGDDGDGDEGGGSHEARSPYAAPAPAPAATTPPPFQGEARPFTPPLPAPSPAPAPSASAPPAPPSSEPGE